MSVWKHVVMYDKGGKKESILHLFSLKLKSIGILIFFLYIYIEAVATSTATTLYYV